MDLDLNVLVSHVLPLKVYSLLVNAPMFLLNTQCYTL